MDDLEFATWAKSQADLISHDLRTIEIPEPPRPLSPYMSRDFVIPFMGSMRVAVLNSVRITDGVNVAKRWELVEVKHYP